MEVYVVFAGGGVKGAALAGALAALEQSELSIDFEIRGFGGTSAGALVAALAAAGFSGEEILTLMQSDVHPKKLLDDSAGTALKSAVSHLTTGLDILESNSFRWMKALKFCNLYKKAEPQLKLLKGKNGLYEGARFQQVLLKLFKDKLNLRKDIADVTFDQVFQARNCELRIIASNLSKNQAELFSTNAENTYGTSVIDAVSASAAYPFLFQPRTFKNSHQLVDGGLASNLPAFLFAEEFRQNRIPTIAFDLIREEEEEIKEAEGKEKAPLSYAKDLLDTGLTASDRLLRKHVPGIYTVDIAVPADVTTLKFDLTTADISSLYKAGHYATIEALKKIRDFSDHIEKTKRASANAVTKMRPSGAQTFSAAQIKVLRANQNVQIEVCARYGERRILEPPLWAFAQMIEQHSAAKILRTNIMLPVNDSDDLRIVTFAHGFRDDDPDRFLILKGESGCTGIAFKDRSPMCAALDSESQKAWGLTEDEIKQVANDRRSLLCAPIFARPIDKGDDVKSVRVVGVLSVDSATQLRETQWVETETAEINPKIIEIIVEWSYIFSSLLAI